MFIVGIDVAKRNHEVTVITSAGQVVCKGFRISNTCTGYNRMMERLGKLTNLKSQFIFVMEFTAHCWLALYTCLRKGGYQVVILNPIQTHHIGDVSPQIKNRCKGFSGYCQCQSLQADRDPLDKQ